MKFDWSSVETIDDFELSTKASLCGKALTRQETQNTLHNYETLDTSRLENTLHNYRLVEIDNQYQFQNTLHNYGSLDTSRPQNTLHNYGKLYE